MRKLRFVLSVLVLVFLALSSVRGLAGDKPADAPGSGGFSTPPPEKKFDLGGLDLSKPVVEALPVKPPEKAQKPEAKPVVTYKAIELAPEGAEFVLEIPSVTRILRDAGASPFGRLMAADRLGPVWNRQVLGRARLIPPLGEGMPDGDAILDVLGRLVESLSGEVVLAVYPPADGSTARHALLVAELPPSQQPAFRASLEEIKSKLGLSHEATTENIVKGDFTLQYVKGKNGLHLTWGFIGNQLAAEVALSRAKPDARICEDKLLAAALSRGERSLARETIRAEERAALPKDAHLYLRADARWLAAMGGTPQATPAPTGVRFLSGTVTFDPRGARERVFVSLDPEGALAKLLPTHGPADELARFMPLNAYAFEIDRLEPGAASTMFQQFKAALPELQARQFKEWVETIDKKSELSFEKDVLGALAGDLAAAWVRNSAVPGAEPELLLVLAPEDAEKAHKVLVGLERAAGGEFKDEPYLGARIRFREESKEPPRKRAEAAAGRGELQLPGAFGFRPSGRGQPGTPAWPAGGPLEYFKAYAFSGNCVVLGTSPRIVRTALRQRDPAQHASSLVDKPDYKAARAVLGSVPSEVSSGYLDLRRLGELLYAEAGSGGHLVELPPADKVLEEVSGLVWSTRRGEKANGASVEVYSSIGLIPLSGVMAAHGWLDSLDAAAAEEARQHTVKLKALWRGMEIFATEFGRYPLSFSELFPAYVPDGSVFLTPQQARQAGQAPILKVEDLEANCGYQYVSGRVPSSAGNSVVIYSTKPDAAGYHWCLRVNGKVDRVKGKALEGLLGSGLKPAAAKK